jgi:peptidoglycan/xylan/chitin deacetylase (PgdA/CDA1 family)
MAVFLRAMIPVFALGAGTWLGLGRPDLRSALSAGSHALEDAAHGVTEAEANASRPTAPTAVPPLERHPTTVDASALPDPPLPWPRLNPDDSGERAWLLAEGPARTRDTARRLVTFTFDDGPFPETAPTILKILETHHVRAAFFLIGRYLAGTDHRAAETRMWAKRIADAGHFVGNHTFDHRLLTGLSHQAALDEIDRSASEIERATGGRPMLFRPPYGEVDPWLQGVMRDRHLELLLWSVDVEDMKRDDPDEIADLLESQLSYKQGGIVLLHDMHWPSVKAFNRLLRWLEAEKWDPARPQRPGWDIVDLPEYLRATAAAPQPFATREELERARRGAAERRARVTPHEPRL